jgi:hypothetical protein
MDFTTNISELSSIPFPDEGTGATRFVSDMSAKATRNQFARSMTLQRAPDDESRKASANSVPDSILAVWTRIGSANMSVRMYRDIVRLAMQPSGWRGPGSFALRSSSLKDFLEFWYAVRDEAAEPEVTLAPDGSIHAEWFKSPRERLDVRFAEKKVIFGLLTSKSILEGAENINLVALILKSHRSQPLKWVAR